MESQTVPFYSRPVVRWAFVAAVFFGVVEYCVLDLKEGGPWYREHLRGEFTLAIAPNIIAALVAFIAVYFLIDRNDQRSRYIGAMRSIRLAAKTNKKTALTEEQVQDLMVASVESISLLYFGTSKPPCSGLQLDGKSCTNCPGSPQAASSDGSCSKCNEIPECWSVREKPVVH